MATNDIVLDIGRSGKKFENNHELRQAIQEYLNTPVNEKNVSRIAALYGHPMGAWEFEDSMTDFSGIFAFNRQFRGTTPEEDISGWNLENGIHFANMFYMATSFNGDISKWNVRNAISFSNMFAFASSLTSPILNNWDVSKCSDFSYMFANATSVVPIGLDQWDVSSGLFFRAMFRNVANINANLSRWNMERAIDLSEMFSGASVFNQDLSSWNVQHTKSFAAIFNEAFAFNQDLTKWNIGQADDLSLIFRRTNLNHDYCPWANKIGNNTRTGRMFFRTKCEFQGDPSETQNSTTGLLQGPFCFDCMYTEADGTSSAVGMNNKSMLWTSAMVVLCLLSWTRN